MHRDDSNSSHNLVKRYGFGSEADKVVDEDVVVDACGDIGIGDSVELDDVVHRETKKIKTRY